MPDPTVQTVQENRDVTQVLAKDTSTQATVTLTGAVQTAVTDALGNRGFVNTHQYLVTQDGRLLRDATTEAVFTCTRCKRTPFSEAAITPCACGKVVCRYRCTRTARDGVHRCITCHRQHLWRRFRQWLFRLH